MEEWNTLISKYLAEEISAEEKLLLERWIRQDSDNNRYFEQFKEIWLAARQPIDEPEPDVPKALRGIRQAIAREEKEVPVISNLSIYRYARRIAAVLIVGMVLGVGYFMTVKTASIPLAHLITPANRTGVVSLIDGTKVWLNVNSEILYPERFSDTIREVTLRGEAYFDVAKDHTKPFIIHTGNITTRVVGTSFNVRAIPGEENTLVTVTSGRVVFYCNGSKQNKVLLTKGDRGVAQGQSGIVSKDLNFLSWQSGKIVFDNTSFAEVSKVLSDCYHTKIVAGKSISTCRLTSAYHNQPLSSILSEFQNVYGVSIIREGDVIRLSGKGCE